MMNANENFTRAVSKAAEPAEVFTALEEYCLNTVGAKLFTVMTNDTQTHEAERVYTNMPDAYPLSGRKGYNPTRWSEITLERQETFVANSIEDIATVFDDYPLIQSLGCESVINVPVIVNNQVIATLNLLHEKGYYTDTRVKQAEQLKLPGTVCMLLAQHLKGAHQ